ncbi:hypothetical protein I4U23_003101 [Adineta vaga]|nr:hypothetical protein I4U23_003101 [Adineta vaga]
MTTDTNIIKQNIVLPNEADEGKLAFVLLNVFTREECQEWIEISEQHGYSPALINMGQQQVLRTDVRNNHRCMIDDVDMANILFDRIKAYLPNLWNNDHIVGLNERLRFLRYDPGQKFQPHFDGIFIRNDESMERSYITIQLYLNEGFEGGETTFVHHTKSSQNVPCIPRTGMVLVFEHKLFHEGSALIKGRKYTVRTDVMYRPDKHNNSAQNDDDDDDN